MEPPKDRKPEDQKPDNQKPDIRYPTTWGYRIVGPSEEDIRALVAEVVGDAEHELLVGNESSGGKYVSLNLRLLVPDEATRLRVYEQLQDSDAVRLVL